MHNVSEIKRQEVLDRAEEASLLAQDQKGPQWLRDESRGKADGLKEALAILGLDDETLYGPLSAIRAEE